MSAVFRSPNYNQRDPSLALQFIILHYTGMKTATEALARLCDPAAEVSAHYLIDENGALFSLVDDEQRAWHAGKSSWCHITDINSASIGIELVNPGHQNGYRPYPEAQMTALKKLLHDLIARHHMDAATCVLGHSDIAPGRKEDPGELFPWEAFAQDGLGLWPKPHTSDYGHADDHEVQIMLRSIGYTCADTGVYDRSMREALVAFQRHYEPRNLTGTPEPETIARLRALLRLMGTEKLNPARVA